MAGIYPREAVRVKVKVRGVAFVPRGRTRRSMCACMCAKQTTTKYADYPFLISFIYLFLFLPHMAEM